MAKSRAIANLAVVITARTKRFEKGFARATKRLKKFGKSILSITAGVRKLGAILLGAIGVGSLAAFTAAIAISVEALDKLAKTADKLGIVPKQLTAFRFAAKKAGIETRTFDMALQRMVRRVSEAGAGTGEAKDAIKELGLDARFLAKMSPDKQLRAISVAMMKVGKQADRVRLSFKLFDSEGVAMVNLMTAGAKVFDEAEARIKRYGMAWVRFDLKKVEAFNDAMSDMRMALTGLRDRFTVGISTYLTVITEKLTEMVLGVADFGNTMVEGFVAAAGAAGKLLDVMRSIQTLHLEAQIVALKAALPVAVAKGSLTGLGRLIRMQLATLGIPLPGRSGTSPSMADASGIAQAIGELEVRLSDLDKMPKAANAWVDAAKDLIAQMRIEVRARDAQIRASLQPGGLLGMLWRGIQTKLPGMAATATKAAGAGAAKYQWGQVSQTRTAFPSGVGAVAQVKKQPVQDEKLTSLVQSMWEWFKQNAPAQQAAWAIVR